MKNKVITFLNEGGHPLSGGQDGLLGVLWVTKLPPGKIKTLTKQLEEEESVPKDALASNDAQSILQQPGIMEQASVNASAPSGQSSSSRSRRSPITRLLPTRTRHQVVSAPTSEDVSVNDISLRTCASLPIRHMRGGRDGLANSFSRSRRLQRLARRFPKSEVDDLSLDLLYDFFESFAPQPLASFMLDDGEEDSAGDAQGEAQDDHDGVVAGAVVDAHEDSRSDRKDVVDGEQTESSSAVPSPTLANGAAMPEQLVDSPTVSMDAMQNSSPSESGNMAGMADMHTEVMMLRRLVQAELREARHVQEARYAQLQDTVNEAVRLATSLEERMDAMRMPEVRGPPRPSVVLSLTVVDAIASVLLFFIAVFLARPFAFVKNLVVRNPRVQDCRKELGQRASRGWRLSGREFDDPFLGTVAKRISYSAATALGE